MGGKKYTYNTDAAKNKLIIITGATSGLGKATAHELALRKAKVILACRNMQECETVGFQVCNEDSFFAFWRWFSFQVAKQIRFQSKNKAVECRELDLSSHESIRKFVEEFNESMPSLNNNSWSYDSNL